MTSARGIRAGAAFIELYANDNRLVRGLKRAQRRLRAFGDSVSSIGKRMAAISTAAFAPVGLISIKAASDAQETLSRFEQVFGTQAKAAREFADAMAKEVGRSKFAVIDALSTFQSFFVGLGFGPEKARGLSEALQTLATDFASFNNLSDAEGMQRFISALSGSGEVLDRFGINIKQAALQQELLRMGITKSFQSVTEQEKALARLNIIMKAMGSQGAIGDAVRTAGSFANRMKALKGNLHDTAVEIGRALLPVVTPMVEKLAHIVRVTGDWIKQNQELVATIFKVAAGIALAGVVLVAIGTGIVAIGAIFGGFAGIIGGVGTAIGVMGTALAAILSPIGLVITGVVGVGAVILHSTGSAGKAIGWLGDRFNELKAFTGGVFQGIRDALAAGDMALAAKILWLSLKVVWEKGAAALKGVWLEVKRFFVGNAQKMWFGAMAAAQIGFHGLEVAWIETTSFMSKTWTRFTTGFQKIWETATSFVAKRMLEIQGLFDDSLDVDAAKKGIDDDLNAKLNELDAAARNKLDSRERKRQQDRADSKELNDLTLAEIGRQFEEAQQALDEKTGEKIAEAKKALEDARKELDAAFARAKKKRAAVTSDGGSEVLSGGPDDLLARVKGALSGVGQAIEEKVSVRGTFNAAAAQGLEASNGAAERTAKATEETVKNTRRIIDTIRDSGMAFV